MSDACAHAQQVLADSDCLHDEAAVQAGYDRLAQEIHADYADTNPLFLCVMIGGLVPTAELIRRFDFPFELDYLHATRYRGETTGGGLVWKVSPSSMLGGRHVLVIDDILDEGHTLKAILSALQEQQPAALRTAVLCHKRHDRRVEGVHAEYIGLDVEDRYVFGCGMDYRNYHRQLGSIRAVAEPMAGAAS